MKGAKKSTRTSTTSSTSKKSIAPKRTPENNEEQENDIFAVPMDDGEATRPVNRLKRLSILEALKGKDSAPEKKRVKITKTTTADGTKKAEDPSPPINTTFPEKLVFPPKPEGTIKFASWNVSGLTAAIKKGFKRYVDAEDPDILCLQEIKINEPMNNVVNSNKYPCREWAFDHSSKGYSGVAVFSKIEPISKKRGLPTHPNPETTKGRCYTLEFPTLYYVCCYVPNAGDKLSRLPERMVWDGAMERYLRELDAKKPVIWAGDLNVAHQEIDLARPAASKRSPGFSKEERDNFEKILNGGESKFVDTWRHFHPDTVGGYSFYSYRAQSRAKGIGWRVDYHVVSERILDKVIESEIRNECYGASDHVPLVMVLRDGL